MGGGDGGLGERKGREGRRVVTRGEGEGRWCAEGGKGLAGRGVGERETILPTEIRAAFKMCVWGGVCVCGGVFVCCGFGCVFCTRVTS